MDETTARALFGQEVAKLVGGPLDGELRVIEDDKLPATLKFAALETLPEHTDGPPAAIPIGIDHHVYRRQPCSFDKIRQIHTYRYVPASPC